MFLRRSIPHALALSVLAAGSIAPVALAVDGATKQDPCAEVAGLQFVPPSDALACLRSFPFNETLRQNVLSVVSGVFDFYTFEEYYLDSPPPFQESTTNIRADLARINSSHYATDYDFNKDLFDVVNMLNDGHTQWEPACYWSAYQNVLPAPVISLEVDGVQNLYVIPDSVALLTQLGTNFTDYFDSIHFDWQRLAGAKILEIEEMEPYDYVDLIAHTVTGLYLDHGVRVNSVYSSYRIVTGAYSQRVGDLAGPLFPTPDSVTMKLILTNSTISETITIPYVATFLGISFTDKVSYWANNCAVTDVTNGVDVKESLGSRATHIGSSPRSVINDASKAKSVNLPPQFTPSLPLLNTSAGEIKSYILPDSKTGVMFVGSFEGDFVQFQTDTVSAFNSFAEKDVSHLIVDLTDNGGGFVCLGLFLHQYLAGSDFGYPGFQSTTRGNELAKKIVANDIKLGLSAADGLFYPPDNWAFLNDTPLPLSYDYEDPDDPFVVNGVIDPTSQRFHDICTPFNVPVPRTPPINLNNVVIVSNGNCASTCALFSTVMNERHNTRIAVFGGKPGEQLQFKGLGGNQVLEWFDLDTEIKSANLKNDPLAPPDLLVNANMRHNWRTAWSYFNENVPIAYESEPAKFRFAYTPDTYNNPQNLWEFAAQQFFN